LFGWFIGTMSRSDFSETCMPALWLCAFADPDADPGSSDQSHFASVGYGHDTTRVGRRFT
jgi:hypothetical protein